MLYNFKANLVFEKTHLRLVVTSRLRTRFRNAARFQHLKQQRIAFSAVRKIPIENVPHCVASNNQQLMLVKYHQFEKKKKLLSNFLKLFRK